MVPVFTYLCIDDDDLNITIDNGTPRHAPLPPSRVVVQVQSSPNKVPADGLMHARLGRVQVALPVHVSYRPDSQRLHTIAPGTAVAIISYSEKHYAILMRDNLLGYVLKSGIEISDVNLRVPNAATDVRNMTRNQRIIKEALAYMGVPYVWAGNTRRGLDCSALVQNVFKRVGIVLPRHSGDQARIGICVVGPPRMGDRVYFAMKHRGTVSHCGISLGNGQFIHASTNKRSVDVDTLTPGSKYYKKLFTVRRF